MCSMSGIGENRAQRLHRLCAQWEASKECFEDDARAFHAEIQEARAEDRSYGWIAAAINKSRTQAFRIANKLSGPTARD